MSKEIWAPAASHPGAHKLLGWFSYDHLPDGVVKETSKRIANCAHELARNVPASAEATAGLRKLLEAKDCFVRAALERAQAEKEWMESGYTPHGAAYELFVDPERKQAGVPDASGLSTMIACDELIYQGPAGCGKTFALMNLAQYLAQAYSGARIAIVGERKEERVLNASEFELALKDNPVAKQTPISIRRVYEFPGMSHVHLITLDEPERWMEAEFDLVIFNHRSAANMKEWAETEKRWEALLERLTGTKIPHPGRENGHLQMAIIDTCPDHWMHWINARADRLKLRRLQGKHQDNPTVTKEYLEALKRLEGAKRARLYEGRWLSEEEHAELEAAKEGLDASENQS